MGYLSQSPNKRNSCSLVHFPKSWGGLIGLGLPLLLHHHHHHPPPTPFPPQSPKNSGLHVPARSHLLCFYPESKASSPKGCGTQTRRHSGRGGDRRGARPQAPGGGGQREQGGRTGNTAFLQNPRGWGGAGTRPPTETGLRRQWRPSRLDAGLQGSTAPGVVAPLRSLSSPDTGTRERTEPAGLQHGPPVITGRGRTGPHQAHCVLCGGCGSHGAISWTSAPGAADLQLREVGPVAGPTRSRIYRVHRPRASSASCCEETFLGAPVSRGSFRPSPSLLPPVLGTRWHRPSRRSIWAWRPGGGGTFPGAPLSARVHIQD